MSFQIPANDHGALYVLELTGTPPAGLSEKTDAAMMAVLGRVVVNTDYVDTITPDMLADMPLLDLLRRGYDMPISESDAQALAGLQGTAILVMSAAFAGQQVTVQSPPNVRLVAVLRETQAMTVPDPLTSEAAQGAIPGRPTKAPKSNARISGMIAMYALIAMFALVGLMIWVGG